MSRKPQYDWNVRIDVGSGLGLPAEGPLKRRDGSSCKSTFNPMQGLGLATFFSHYSQSEVDRVLQDHILSG